MTIITAHIPDHSTVRFYDQDRHRLMARLEKMRTAYPGVRFTSHLNTKPQVQEQGRHAAI